MLKLRLKAFLYRHTNGVKGIHFVPRVAVGDTKNLGYLNISQPDRRRGPGGAFDN
jgi:hypothetical protein